MSLDLSHSLTRSIHMFDVSFARVSVTRMLSPYRLAFTISQMADMAERRRRGGGGEGGAGGGRLADGERAGVVLAPQQREEPAGGRRAGLAGARRVHLRGPDGQCNRRRITSAGI
jgi:hypothetical protein